MPTGKNGRFTKQYDDNDFIKALSKDSIKSIGIIMAAVGASRSTTRAALDRLEKEGKIKRITIEGIAGDGYQLV